ncbi:GNAT family N-acetyltransferase [Bacillus massilinigeriensis]|uniref:GNAT family N-acetyltransferase n=1 Tax=Bacillus massilionigeriensis TaxID=1805475 RepID=UPI00096B107E|nr:GNAT family N-acetyltransferase [Bacillus massilionigeriensis]
MQLHFYEVKFKGLVEDYQLSEEQLYFTGMPMDCIKQSIKDPDRYSVLTIEEEKLVTFFDLHKNEGAKPYSKNTNSILLRAFSTDFRHQGKGYAKNALTLLPDFVKEHFREMNEIVLAVNVRNEAAQVLYKKCGFIDEGARKIGMKGEQIVMSYYIK